MGMFTGVRVGVSDLEKATVFYDAVLGALGYSGNPMGPVVMYAGEDAMFFIGRPAEGEPDGANGLTINLTASSREAVDTFYKEALAHGGTDAGPPGTREFAPGAYLAYIRDPDGNKLGAFCPAG